MWLEGEIIELDCFIVDCLVGQIWSSAMVPALITLFCLTSDNILQQSGCPVSVTNAREISCLIEILLFSLMYNRMVLMVICWHYRMPFNVNGCVSTLTKVDWIKWMLRLVLMIVYFLVMNSKRCTTDFWQMKTQRASSQWHQLLSS